MATNSRQGLPKGTKWKVNMSRNRDGETMYLMVYGPRKEQAIAIVKASVRGTGWTVTGAEPAE